MNRPIRMLQQEGTVYMPEKIITRTYETAPTTARNMLELAAFLSLIGLLQLIGIITFPTDSLPSLSCGLVIFLTLFLGSFLFLALMLWRRVRIDSRGLHRRSVFGWTSWTWKDFGSGVIVWTGAAYVDKRRRFGKRRLSLQFLGEEDCQELLVLVRPHWKKPEAMEAPASISMRQGFWRPWRLLCQDAGIEFGQGREKRFYTWDEIQRVQIHKADADHPGFISCRVYLEDRCIALLSYSRKRYKGPKAIAILAFFQAHLPAEKLCAFSPEALPESVEGCEQFLGWLYWQRRSRNYAHYLAVALSPIIIAFALSNLIALLISYPLLRPQMVFLFFSQLAPLLPVALHFQITFFFFDFKWRDTLIFRLERLQAHLSDTPFYPSSDERCPKIAKASFVLTLSLTLLLCAFLPWALWNNAVETQKLEKLLRACEARGEAISVADLEAAHPIPTDTENAADLYLEAFKEFSYTTPEKESLFDDYICQRPLVSEVSEETKKLLEGQVEKNLVTLALVHQAAAIKPCYYAHDYSKGFQVDIPYEKKIIAAAKLLYAQSALQLMAGEDSLALESLLDSFALGRSLDREAMLISRLIQMRIYQISYWGLEQYLAYGALSPESLARLEETIPNTNAAENLRSALLMERCLTIITLYDTGDPFLSPQRLSSTMLQQQRFIDLATEPLERSFPEAVRIGEELQDLEMRYPNRLDLMLCPDYSRVFTHAIRTKGLREMSLTALALERYRLPFGILPDSLEDLVPDFLEEVPQDLFNGKPLRFEKAGNAYRLRSVGKNGVFDEGDTGDDFDFSVGWVQTHRNDE